MGRVLNSVPGAGVSHQTISTRPHPQASQPAGPEQLNSDAATDGRLAGSPGDGKAVPNVRSVPAEKRPRARVTPRAAFGTQRTEPSKNPARRSAGRAASS